jgi:colicin import membrane protein
MLNSFLISLGAHIAILVFALVSFKTTTIRPQREAAAQPMNTKPVIKASMINNEDVKMALERQKQAELDQQLAENKRKADNLANEKKALQLKQELEAIKKQKLIEQAAVKKASQEKLQAQAEAKKIQEQMLADKKNKQKIEKELAANKAAIAKQQATTVAQQQAAAAAAKLAAEKKAEAEFQEWVDGEVNKFAALLEQKIVDNRNNLFTFSSELSCDVEIKLTDNGTLISAVIVQSSGNNEYDDFQLKAIAKAAPFSMPEDKAVLAKFQDIILNLKNDGERASEIS